MRILLIFLSAGFVACDAEPVTEGPARSKAPTEVEPGAQGVAEPQAERGPTVKPRLAGPRLEGCMLPDGGYDLNCHHRAGAQGAYPAVPRRQQSLGGGPPARAQVVASCLAEGGYDLDCHTRATAEEEVIRHDEERAPDEEEEEEFIREDAEREVEDDACPDRAVDDRRYSACIDDQGRL